MRGLGECKIAGHTFVVRELTYPQVLEQIRQIQEPKDEPGGLDWLFGPRYMPRATIEAIVGEELEPFMEKHELAPSEIEPLYKKAVEVNPHLAGAMKEMREVALAMRVELSKISTSLSQLFAGQQSSSPAEDMPDLKNMDSPTSSKQ